MAVYLSAKKLKKDFDESISIGKCSDNLCKDFKLLAERLYTTIGAYNHPDKNACIMYAVEEAFIKWNKYDEKKSPNLFAFFTSMISNDIKLHYNYLNRLNHRTISINSFENKDKD